MGFFNIAQFEVEYNHGRLRYKFIQIQSTVESNIKKFSLFITRGAGNICFHCFWNNIRPMSYKFLKIDP